MIIKNGRIVYGKDFELTAEAAINNATGARDSTTRLDNSTEVEGDDPLLFRGDRFTWDGAIQANPGGVKALRAEVRAMAYHVQKMGENKGFEFEGSMMPSDAQSIAAMKSAIPDLGADVRKVNMHGISISGNQARLRAIHKAMTDHVMVWNDRAYDINIAAENTEDYADLVNIINNQALTG